MSTSRPTEQKGAAVDRRGWPGCSCGHPASWHGVLISGIVACADVNCGRCELREGTVPVPREVKS